MEQPIETDWEQKNSYPINKIMFDDVKSIWEKN